MDEKFMLVTEMDESLWLHCLNDMIQPMLREDKEYQNYIEMERKILASSESLTCALEWEKPCDLTSEDSEKILKILEIREEMDGIVQKKIAIAMQNKMLKLFREYEKYEKKIGPC